MEIKNKIRDLAEQSLPGSEFFIVEVKVTGKGANQKILVTADGDNGISIDDCAELSRKLGDLLDATEFFPDSYHLEVSSPGADEAIQNPRQYTKNTGRRLEVLNEDDELIVGTLEGIKENCIVLLPEVKKKKASGKDKKEEIIRLEIPFNKIKKSNVIISFK